MEYSNFSFSTFVINLTTAPPSAKLIHIASCAKRSDGGASHDRELNEYVNVIFQVDTTVSSGRLKNSWTGRA